MPGTTYRGMIMDVRATFTRINSSYSKNFPTPLKQYKMRDRGYYGIFRSGYHPPVHQGTEKKDRAGLDTFVIDELVKRNQHIFAVIDPHDKNPPDLPFCILHIIRFPFWYSYGLCGFIFYMIMAKMVFKLLLNVRK
jgi:hypothetical protein